MSPQGAKRRPDAAIAEIAARQHGVLSVTQLRAAGVDSSAIKRRVAAGRLHRIHRGVYAVGHARLSNEGRWLAAVLACGEGAVLSHRGAGELWGILRSRRRSGAGASGKGPPVDVTVTGGGGRKTRSGISLHRSSTLSSTDCTRRDGVPVTKPARTLRDLRAVISEPQWAAAVREAEFLRLPIDGVISDSNSPDRTRTDLESSFMALVRRHRLPRPEVNVPVDGYEVDFLWRDRRLIVEVDGWESHRGRSAFEEDRARDTRLKTLGHDVLRFTWRQIESDSRSIAAAIRAVLTRRS
jgi:very-short-patch-repair endonuclease